MRAYAKYPGEKNWLFDENMKPLVNNPAWVRAIQSIIDALLEVSRRPDQRRSRHDRVSTIPAGHRLAPRMVGRHRFDGENERHIDDRRRG